MKRVLSLILSLCLLAGFAAVPVSAEEVLTTDAFDPTVRYSVTDSNLTGWGLAFCFTLNASDVRMNKSTSAVVLNYATLEYAGEACKITRIGAVVTHLAGVAGDDSRMTRETAAQYDQMKDAKVAKLYETSKTACRFAVRVIDIPYESEAAMIYARPYVEIQYQGEKITLYGETDSACYLDKMLESTIKLPFYGTDVDGKERLFVGDTSVIEQYLYLEIQDELDDWMVLPNDDSTVVLGFFDAAGQELGTEEFTLPELSQANATTVLKATLPENTAEVKLLETSIRYWSAWE